MADAHVQVEGIPSSLLHSSVVPSARDRAFVLESIQESQAAIEEVDREIKLLEEEVAQRKLHHSNLIENTSLKQGILSPLRRMPPEILAMIFLHYHADSAVNWPRSSSLESPWTIGKVCSYWRSVYISLPCIWSKIHLDLSSITNPTSQIVDSVTELLSTCFIRSSREQLQVTLRYRPIVGNEERHTVMLVRSLLTRLVDASLRWGGLTLDVQDLISSQAILSNARGRVPVLRSLSLLNPGANADPFAWEPMDAFSDAPCLSRLALYGTVHPKSTFRIPWGQLKHLKSRVSTFAEGEFSKILRESNLLEELVTEDERILDIPPDEHTSFHINLPNVFSLSVVNKGVYMSRVFELLTTPALTRLSIRATASCKVDSIVTMIKRSSISQQLRVLNFQTSMAVDLAWDDNTAVERLLRAVPGVEECSLTVCKSADPLLHALEVRKPSASRPTLLPNLQCFELCDSCYANTSALNNMVESRTHNVGAVQKEEGVEEGVVAQLKKIVLDLYVTVKRPHLELDSITDLCTRRGVEIMASVKK